MRYPDTFPTVRARAYTCSSNLAQKDSRCEGRNAHRIIYKQAYQRTCNLGVERIVATIVEREACTCTARAGVRQYRGRLRKRRVHGRARTLCKPSAARARIERLVAGCSCIKLLPVVCCSSATLKDGPKAGRMQPTHGQHQVLEVHGEKCTLSTA